MKIIINLLATISIVSIYQPNELLLLNKLNYNNLLDLIKESNLLNFEVLIDRKLNELKFYNYNHFHNINFDFI